MIDFDLDWLSSLGFETDGECRAWKESTLSGPVTRLQIDLDMGCDGCTVSHDPRMYSIIRMPLNRSELLNLCEVLGIEAK